MTTVFLYTTISVALYYLASRAKITEWLWSRYPKPIEYWTLCAACSGFFYGLGLGVLVGRTLELPFAGLDPLAWYTPIVAAGSSMVWTPVVAYLMVVSWQRLLTTDEDETIDEITDPQRKILPLRPKD